MIFSITSNYPFKKRFSISTGKSGKRFLFPLPASFSRLPSTKGQRAPSFASFSLSSTYREPLLNERMNISRVRFQPTRFTFPLIFSFRCFPPLPPVRCTVRGKAIPKRRVYDPESMIFQDGWVSNDTFTSTIHRFIIRCNLADCSLVQ